MESLTKYLGIPSLAGLVLGAGLLFHNIDVTKRYHSFVEETTRSIPALAQFDALDLTLDDLVGSERALTIYTIKPITLIHVGKTYFISPPIYHSPSVDESVKDLSSARSNLTQNKVNENHEVKIIDEQIRIMQDDLNKTEKGKSESFYEPKRIGIKGIQERTEQELKKLKGEIPENIMKTRNSLHLQSKYESIAGLLFSVTSGIGLGLCGLFKLLDRYT